MKPIIAVLGTKDTGKTTLMIKLINHFTAKGFKILSAKHVSHKDIQVDTPNTDSYKLKQAGSKIVFLLTPQTTVIFKNTNETEFNLNIIDALASKEIDLILLEGFSKWVKNNPNIGKIICYTDIKEKEKIEKTISQPIIGYYSYNTVSKQEEKLNQLINKILNFIEETDKINQILSKLPKLDCKQCGYKNCLELAKMIYQKKEKLEKCQVIINQKSLNVQVKIGEKSIPLKPFTAKIIKNTTYGLISSLKMVDNKLKKYSKLSIIIE
ncbi:MAG: molybdopterin-guanine dinucleotide biosynthesis protein B [Candidatus Odinarchaeia archaeon]